MDENKNWINWRRYSLTKLIVFIAYQNTINFTAVEEGLYLALSSGASGASITTTGSTVKSYNTASNGPDLVKFIRCNVGDNITTSCSGSGSTSALYFLRGYNNVVGEASLQSVANNNTTACGYTDNYANLMFGIGRGATVSYTSSYEGDNAIIKSSNSNCSFAVSPTSDYCRFTISTNQYGGGVMGYCILE